MLPSPDSPQEHALALVARKDAIEAEIKTHVDILEANSSDMTTPLVDRDGFPRADLDIYAVRTARVRIIELRNDLKDVMDEIGKALEHVYDPARVVAAPSAEGPSSAPIGEAESEGNLQPFARVDSVAPGSPAAESGLHREDLIIKSGHLIRSSFTEAALQPLAELVTGSENRELPVQVLRGEERVTLNFTPRKGWGGRGMLGCHIVPYSPS
ncbi:hypothetical protein SCLCIDRAFT_752446 [Scleroderma citrinum Foug A]|uniref:Probable 26S proteasome regulatory subunit p27 n=1 Tax=Scleroderma citrinum Foug A TaxID=1036808 RepID=A0A0C3E4E4_9AGAM|nr:hypothetical protein SCLCIDRAFT_752446 [Scleroderma citrinum Foug A]